MGFFYAMTTAIFWFRQDLRLSDNPAFLKACEEYDSVLPIYIDDNEHLDRTLGEASRAWLHHSLTSLEASLQKLGSNLACYQGSAAKVIETICTKSDAAKAEIAAEKIRLAVKQHEFPEVGNITVSIGVCEVNQELSILKMIDCADQALYRAKENGRDQVCVFVPEKLESLDKKKVPSRKMVSA